jgi:hypothetical protein
MPSGRQIRKLFSKIALLLSLALASGSAQAQTSKSKLVLGLVLPKATSGTESDTDAINAATDAFFLSKRFKIVERNELNAVFSEKDIQEFLGGKINSELTETLGLDLIGVVNHSNNRLRSTDGIEAVHWIIDVRLVDVRTATIIGTLSSERENRIRPPATAREAAESLFESIRESFAPTGYVIEVRGDQIIVDLGDILEVVREGRSIIHPVTGEVIPGEMEAIGELKVISATNKTSICKPKKSNLQVANASLVRLKKDSAVWKIWLRHVPFVRGFAQPGKSIPN